MLFDYGLPVGLLGQLMGARGHDAVQARCHHLVRFDLDRTSQRQHWRDPPSGTNSMASSHPRGKLDSYLYGLNSKRLNLTRLHCLNTALNLSCCLDVDFSAPYMRLHRKAEYP